MARADRFDDDAPWRVRILRIRDGDGNGNGKVLGAGVIVAGDQVLTCAHVLGSGDPAKAVHVEVVGRPGLPPIVGRVPPGWCIPPRADERGDLALLALDRSVPDDCVARLRRLPPWHERLPARAFGFPSDMEYGVWADLRVTGRSGPGNEWVQLDPPGSRARVDRGFSGAGVSVADQSGEYVIGVVVTRRAKDELAWMILMDTVVRYLPQLSGRMTTWPPPSEPTQLIGEFMGGRLRIGVLIVLVGERSSPASAALTQAMQDAGSGSRTGTEDARPAEVTPRIQVGIDVTHLTVDDVTARIADQTGTRIDQPPPEGSMPEVDVVLDGVDEAADPEALVTGVVAPLFERDAQVLLGYRSEPPPSVVRLSVEALAKLIDEVETEESRAWQRHTHADKRIAGLPALPAHARELRDRLAEIRRAAAGASVIAEIGTVAQEAADARWAVTAVMRDVESALARREELRGRLNGYKARAARYGLVEDVRLAKLYREAHDALWRGRCDLAKAASLVEQYGDGSRP
jgi:hypothetical protein